MKRDASTNDQDILPSNKVISRKSTGTKVFMSTTSNGASSSKTASKYGALSNILSMKPNRVRNDPTVEREAITEIGTVQSKQKAVVAANDNNEPTCRACCRRPTFK